jgi:hypothetical protein
MFPKCHHGGVNRSSIRSDVSWTYSPRPTMLTANADREPLVRSRLDAGRHAAGARMSALLPHTRRWDQARTHTSTAAVLAAGAMIAGAMTHGPHAQTADLHGWIGTKTVHSRVGTFEFMGGDPTVDAARQLDVVRTPDPFDKAVTILPRFVPPSPKEYNTRGNRDLQPSCGAPTGPGGSLWCPSEHREAIETPRSCPRNV